MSLFQVHGTYDPAGKVNDLVIGYGVEEAPTRHVVNNPAALWQGLDARGRAVALEIEDEAGNHTVVQFS